MNRVARELSHIASELLPRIKATFVRTPKIEDRELHSIHFDIQRFVSTLRNNEGIECFVTRRDDGKMMEFTIGFTDHNQMKAIVRSIKEMMEKLAKKTGMKVTVDTSPKAFDDNMKKASDEIPQKYWAIIKNGRVVISGGKVGVTLEYLSDLARNANGEVVFGDTPFHKQMEVGDILGYTWEQIQKCSKDIDLTKSEEKS